MMEFNKYRPRHPLLRQCIRHFWINSGTMPALNHKLLPIRNIDLVINLSPRPIRLIENGAAPSSQSCYFTGIMDRYRYTWKQPPGETKLLGVSFHPAGFYPFFQIPLSEFKNLILDISLLNSHLSRELTNSILEEKTDRAILHSLEAVLLELLDSSLIPDIKMRSLVTAFTAVDGQTIETFCDTTGIHKRTLERFFNKHLGTSPKIYLRINRFRKALHAIQNNGFNTLTEVAYDCGYYDQTHFIREFKHFTGSSPSRFLKEKRSVQQVCSPE